MRCSFSCSHHSAALAEPRETLVEPWWNPGGTLVEPFLRADPKAFSCWGKTKNEKHNAGHSADLRDGNSLFRGHQARVNVCLRISSENKRCKANELAPVSLSCSGTLFGCCNMALEPRLPPYHLAKPQPRERAGVRCVRRAPGGESDFADVGAVAPPRLDREGLRGAGHGRGQRCQRSIWAWVKIKPARDHRF